jgi:ubiE/COQ5 methyltransferase family
MTKTHFGYETVEEQEKARKVAGVFHSVARKYDLMNDLMSGGLHRVWKQFAIAQAKVRPGFKVLDIAGGTGDLAKRCPDPGVALRRRADSLSRQLLRRGDGGVRVAQHDA